MSDPRSPSDRVARWVALNVAIREPAVIDIEGKRLAHAILDAWEAMSVEEQNAAEKEWRAHPDPWR